MKNPIPPAVQHLASSALTSGELTVAIVSADRGQIDRLESMLQLVPGAAGHAVFETTIQQLGTLAIQPAPDVLIADGICAGSGDLEALELLGQAHPHMDFILVGADQSADFLIAAMRTGVREVLPAPVGAEALGAAIERIRRKRGFMPATQGKIVALVSCKGGSGATFLAANLAVELAARGGKKVALLDFDLQFGDALMFLSDQKPAATLLDVARGIHRLDAAYLTSSMVAVAPGLSVLPAPEDPAHGMEVTPEHIDAVLRLARNHFDLVVIDAGRVLNAQTIRALDHADTIFAVLQASMPFLRDGRRLLDVFRSLGYPDRKIGLIVNRYEKGGDIGIGNLEQALGAKVLHTIPNHFEAAAASINQGVPVTRLMPRSPISKALSGWSDTLAEPATQATPHWFARTFGQPFRRPAVRHAGPSTATTYP